MKKVVHVSTPLAYGIPDNIPFDEDSQPGRLVSDYSRSKYLGDQAGWKKHRENGLPLTIAHLAAVIDAGDDKATMEVKRALDGDMPALVGADTTYTYLYVGDAVMAIDAALHHKDSVGHRYLIGNQRATTRQYFNMIARLANVSVPDWNIPEAILLPFAKGMEKLSRYTGKRPMLPDDVLNTTAAGSLLFDASKSVDELSMNYTPLETALRESIEYIRGQ